MNPVSDLNPVRVVHTGDAVAWLKNNRAIPGVSVITSIPDFSEFPKMTINEWKDWFTETARLVLSACPDDGVTIFFQTDIKHDGQWVEKSYLCQKAAEQEGHATLWHKIACRVDAGNPTFGRPGYSHIICFSKGVRAEVAKSTADVLPEVGEKTWERGMGLKACLAACRFVLENTETRKIVNPFCGHGTVLAVANSLGMEAHGIELSRKRAEKARGLKIGDI